MQASQQQFLSLLCVYVLKIYKEPTMKFEEYQSEASQTALYPNRLRNLEYPTLGLTGEAGEVANIVKKIQRDFGGQITDEIRGKLKDELGDVLWYISACADELGLTLAEIAQYNVEKLAKRHLGK
jgi:NTP pyrophosphatase (non-canonical NTP hydrolase)